MTDQYETRVITDPKEARKLGVRVGVTLRVPVPKPAKE